MSSIPGATMVATPPPVTRTNKRSLAESVAGDSEFGTTAGEPSAADTGGGANTAFPPAPPPPGIAAGVTSLHLNQKVVPMAIYPDQQLRLEPTDPDNDKRAVQHHVLYAFDFSPSMADRNGESARALAAAIRALPQYHKDLLALLPPECQSGGALEPTVSLAGFSNGCGWEDDDEWIAGSWPRGMDASTRVGDLERVKQSTFKWSDPRLAEACETWAVHLENIIPPDGDFNRPAVGVRGKTGQSTNLEAAVGFSTEALRLLAEESGGYGLAVIATDGCATGEGSPFATDWLRTYHEHALTKAQADGRKGLPVDFSALMMGSHPTITSLSKLVGKRGVLGYAAKAEDIQEGLDSVLRARFDTARGGFDVWSLAVLVGADGKPLGPVEPHAPIPYSREAVSRLGLYAGDNYEAFFDVRVPDAPTDPKDVRGMKVISLATPSLCHAFVDSDDAIARIFEQTFVPPAGVDPNRSRAHTYETFVPVHADPECTRFYARHPLYNHSELNPLAGAGVDTLDPELQVAAPLDNVYVFVKRTSDIEAEAYTELAKTKTHAEAAAVADRYLTRSLAAGSDRMASRFQSLRRESTAMQVRADEGDADATYRSASHSAAACFSQSSAPVEGSVLDEDE